MPFKIRDLSNNVFGKLTAIKRVGRTHLRLSIWKCLCECGNTVDVLGINLTTGRTISCGCYQKECFGKYSKKDKGVSSFNTLIRVYKRDADKRGLCWKLTDFDFKLLISKNCYYCGIEPFQMIKNNHNNGDLIYNGIDRLDNSEGYSIHNCVTCCGVCNKMKNKFTKDNFLKHIVKISKYLGLN